jgi:type IV pilus assembly protein PilA
MHSVIPNMKKREGFTLIELMIVVAIIGILAAIAIPNFIKFQLRAKAGESKINIAGIRTAEESYFADAGTYLDFPETPVVAAGQLKVVFNTAGCPAPLPAFVAGGLGFCWIGWQPEGEVYYTYQLEAQTLGAIVASPASSNQFAIGAVADIDGDTNLNSWGLNQPDITGAAPSPGTFTTAACGTLGPVTVDNTGAILSLVGQVGPCEQIDMGRNTF